jgi:hypothetical protein
MSDRTRAELVAWAAGLFEGEGCITMSDGHVVLQLKMTDEDIVRRFDDIVGYGRVYGPYSYSERRKPFWVWLVQGDAVFSILELLAPWLGERRRKCAYELTGCRFHGESAL